MAAHQPPSPKAPRKRPFRWTSAHLERMPDDGNRYEVLDGELLVTPQARPAHQLTAAMLAFQLHSYCERHGLGVVVGPGAVVWKKNELQPDVLVVPVSEAEFRRTPWIEMPPPILVVEVLSPGSERYDRWRKRDAYLKLGVAEYWIVDDERRRVLVSRPGKEEPVEVTGNVTWQPRTNIDLLVVDLDKLCGG